MSAKKDYYATLSVAKDADDKALKRAYRKLAVQWSAAAAAATVLLVPPPCEQTPRRDPLFPLSPRPPWLPRAPAGC
jgi:hypothetical protein